MSLLSASTSARTLAARPQCRPVLDASAIQFGNDVKRLGHFEPHSSWRILRQWNLMFIGDSVSAAPSC